MKSEGCWLKNNFPINNLLSEGYDFTEIFYKKGLYNSILVLHLHPDTVEKYWCS